VSSALSRQTLLAASFVTIATNVGGRAFGYAREAMIAGYFGTSSTLEIFILAFTLPELITFIAFAAIPFALIPTLRKSRGGGETGEEAIFWSSLICFAALFAVLALGLHLCRGLVLSTLAPTLNAEQERIGEHLLSIVAPFVFFRGMEAFFRSWLFEKKHFIIPSISNIGVNVILLFSLIWMYDRFQIDSLAYGWVMASAAMALFNGYYAFKVVRPSAFTKPRGALIRSLLTFTLSISIIECIALIYPVVDRYLAEAFLGEGAVAALRYATFLIHIPTGMFVVAFTQASFPWISDLTAPAEREKLNQLYSQSLRMIVFFMGFVALGIALFPTELIRVSFQRGAFDSHSLALTVGPLFQLALGVLFYSIYVFQIKFYYARRTLLRLGVILSVMLIIKVVVSLLLVKSMEQQGLALATSVAWLAGAVMMTYDLGRTLQISWIALFFPSAFKTACSLAVVGAGWMYVKQVWPGYATGSLWLVMAKMVVVAAAGGILYLSVAYLSRIKELDRLWDICRRLVRSNG
jgi:putative peptidoglycan lipid II flippase